MVLRTCLACRKHTNNTASRKVTMTNNIRDKSRCSECLSDKSRFMKLKYNKKRIISNIKQTC